MEASFVVRGPRTMPARPRELVAALGLVVVADLALWRAGDAALRGTGAAIFFLVVPLLVVLAARARRITWRFAAILAMFAAIAVRCAYAPTFGSVALGLLGVFALAITLRSRAAFLTDVIASFGATFATMPRRFVAVVAGLRRSLSGSRDQNRSATFAQVAIPAALVALFVGIFGLANPLVGKWLVALRNSVVLPPAARVVSWAALLGGAVLLLRPAIKRSRATEAGDTASAATSAPLGVARNALIALNALFVAYNALDAKYLWAGSPPPGVSERAYAHEGAAWLTVAIAVLTLVVGVMFRAALAHDPRARLSRILATVWLGQGIVLALGTYRRLWIHITTSGLSNARILGIVGTTLVAIGLVQVGVKLWRRRSFAWLLRRQLDALALALLGFTLMPTHLVSAPINLRRVMAHDYQALVHVEDEAREVESAAALLPMLEHDDERIRRGIAALLLDERDALRTQVARGGWRDGEIATTRTLAALESASPRLEAVLGDVARPDAIQPFEYIRNSSIEGEIAQSEISKVEFAPTRPEKLVKHWVETQTKGSFEAGPTGHTEIYAPTVVVDGVERSSQAMLSARARQFSYANNVRSEAPAAFRPTTDPNRIEVALTLSQTTSATVSKTEVVLVLLRDPSNREFRVVEERGTGKALFGAGR